MKYVRAYAWPRHRWRRSRWTASKHHEFPNNNRFGYAYALKKKKKKRSWRFSGTRTRKSKCWFTNFRILYCIVLGLFFFVFVFIIIIFPTVPSDTKIYYLRTEYCIIYPDLRRTPDRWNVNGSATGQNPAIVSYGGRCRDRTRQFWAFSGAVVSSTTVA